MRIPLHGAFRAAFGRDHARHIAEASAALQAAGFLSLEPDLDTPCERFRGRSLRRVAAEGVQDAAFLAAYSCPFEDERGGAADCFLERDMHYLARKHVRAGDRVVEVRSEVNSELNFPPNFEGLVLGCIDADFCK